jgi:mannitol/fructose-specific phosphotransferase system IIA component (Ntr-type)
MLLRELFTEDDFLVGFDPTDKWDAVGRMIRHMVKVGRFDATTGERLHEAVLARERSMSTGMERGIAIPHAAVDGLDRVVACIGVISRSEGLAFESVDGRPTHLVVLLLIPRAQKLVHIRTLADVARVLGKESVRDALLAAETAGEAWHALAEGEGSIA